LQDIFLKAQKFLSDDQHEKEFSSLLKSLRVEIRRTYNQYPSKNGWFAFYARIAIEAFQYEAERGTMKALKWLLELVPDYISDKSVSIHPYRCIILVYTGISFYNFARDIKYRYAAPEETQHQFNELFDHFQDMVVNYTIETNSNININLNLRYFVTIIDAAFVLNTYSHIVDENILSNVREKIKVVVDKKGDSVRRVPNLLKGLYRHYWSKLQEDTEVKRENYTYAIRYFEEYINGMSIFSTYFFDAWCGK